MVLNSYGLGGVMNICLAASGYDFMWQFGALHEMSKSNIWESVDSLYALSGGSVATCYLYIMDDFDIVFEYWGENAGRPQTVKYWHDSYCEYQQVIKNTEHYAKIKPANFGISHIFGGFKWHSVNTYDPIAWKKSLLSSNIPFVTMKPTLNDIFHLDGYIMFCEEKHLPKDTIIVDPAGLHYKTEKEVLRKQGKPMRLVGKITKEEHRENFEMGREAALAWLGL